MEIVRAATADFVFSNLAFRESIGLFGHEDTTGYADAFPTLVYAQFDDGTAWATYLGTPGDPENNYLQDMLIEFVANGGIIES